MYVYITYMSDKKCFTAPAGRGLAGSGWGSFPGSRAAVSGRGAAGGGGPPGEESQRLVFTV